MGLAPESFRDFVEAGMVWREVVRAKYAGGVTITEAEIDRAIANFQPTGASRLQLLELVLPGENGDLSGAQALARKLQVQIETEADFAAFARANSKGETAGSGGQIGWQRLSDLPEASRLALSARSFPTLRPRAGLPPRATPLSQGQASGRATQTHPPPVTAFGYLRGDTTSGTRNEIRHGNVKRVDHPLRAEVDRPPPARVVCHPRNERLIFGQFVFKRQALAFAEPEHNPRLERPPGQHGALAQISEGVRPFNRP
jgi:hypothetical protein